MKPPRRIRITEGSFVLAGCVNLLGTYEEFMLISHTYENCLHSFSTLTHEFYNYFDLPYKKTRACLIRSIFFAFTIEIIISDKNDVRNDFLNSRQIQIEIKKMLGNKKPLLFIPKARSRKSETNTLSSQDTSSRF